MRACFNQLLLLSVLVLSRLPELILAYGHSPVQLTLSLLSHLLSGQVDAPAKTA